MGFDSRVVSQPLSSYCLPFEQIVYINQLVVAETREPHAVIDAHSLRGALGRPLQAFMGHTLYPTVVDKAGALIHGLATAHGFAQGNKRTSYICGTSYLSVHGYEIRPMPFEESGGPLVMLVEKEIGLDKYTQWIADNLI